MRGYTSEGVAMVLQNLNREMRHRKQGVCPTVGRTRLLPIMSEMDILCVQPDGRVI